MEIFALCLAYSSLLNNRVIHDNVNLRNPTLHALIREHGIGYLVTRTQVNPGFRTLHD